MALSAAALANAVTLTDAYGRPLATTDNGDGTATLDIDVDIEGVEVTLGTIKLLDSGGVNTAAVSAGGALKVDGSAVTQPVSFSGATVSGTGTAGTPASGVVTVQGIASGTAQPVSATALPLPTGAATAIKQPALGTAGTASADVLSVQGVASMTALKVDGSGVTQPVSGTVTANIGTVGTLATEATLGSVLTTSDFDSKAGSLTEAAPVTDTASSGLNGRLQRVAQRLTSILAKIPALGTAGAASTDVITVQGIASGVAQVVDGSAVTQPTTAKAATRPTVTAMQTAAVASGNGTSLDVTGMAVAVLNVVSSVPMSGGTTLNFEASVDDTTWVSIAAHTIGTNGALATTATADGDYRIQTAAYKSVRCRISAYSAGTITVKGYAVATPSAPTAVALATSTNEVGNVKNSGTFAVQAAQSGTWTVQPGNTANTTAWKVDGSAVTQPVSGTVTAANAAGDVASAATDSGNPVKIGGQGRTTNPTAVTDGQRVNAIFDKLGKQVVVGCLRALKGVQQTTITSSTAETTIVTAGSSGVFQDLFGLIITNTSATVTKVTIKDATVGTTRVVLEIPATDTRGFTFNESAGIPQASAANNWTATCGTSVAGIEITALYVSNL